MFTLSLHSGTLTRDLGCSHHGRRAYRAVPVSPRLRGARLRSLLAESGFYPQASCVQCSTTCAPSAETILRDLLPGTSHAHTRLAFYPLARVRGKSCTSFTLRSSTDVSVGFNLRWPRSYGFAFLFRGSARRYHAVPDRTRTPGRCRQEPASFPGGLAVRLRTIGFPVPRPLVRLELATTQNSPARDSRRNPQHCCPGVGEVLRPFPCARVRFHAAGQLTGMFQALFTCLTAFFSPFVQTTAALSDSGHV